MLETVLQLGGQPHHEWVIAVFVAIAVLFGVGKGIPAAKERIGRKKNIEPTGVDAEREEREKKQDVIRIDTNTGEIVSSDDERYKYFRNPPDIIERPRHSLTWSGCSLLVLKIFLASIAIGILFYFLFPFVQSRMPR